MIWAKDESGNDAYESHDNANNRIPFHQASPNRGGPNLLFSVSRKIIPLPTSKRVRVCTENEIHLESNPPSCNFHDFSSSQPYESYAQVHHHLSTQQQTSASRPATTRTDSSTLLSPCHICHRKPTKKSDLDSFADCMGCEHRTCFICIRECQGWLPAENQSRSVSFTMQDVEPGEGSGQPVKHDTDNDRSLGWLGSGHCSMVCSRCCVERGSQGDVVCLGCLAGMEGA
jgi:hypothetical protein